MRADPHFIVADLTLAKTVPGMENLIPLGEQSLARARQDAADAARMLAARFAVTAA